MGFLKKLKKKLKKAVKKVAKVTPAGSTIKAAKAIKKGKLSAAVKAINPATAAIIAKSAPGVVAYKKTGSYDAAIDAGTKAGAVGAVALGATQLASGFMGSGGSIPAEIGAAPVTQTSGSILDTIQGYAGQAGQLAGEIGATAGSVRDLFNTFTGGGRQDPPPAAPEPLQSQAPEGFSTQTLLLIGGGVLLLLLVMRRN